MVKDGTDPGFKANGVGFWITFENGWTFSVQFGAGNYCSNQNPGEYYGQLTGQFKPPPCPNAEIAAWDKDGNWHLWDGEQVKGWVGPSEVLYLMTQIATKP